MIRMVKDNCHLEGESALNSIEMGLDYLIEITE